MSLKTRMRGSGPSQSMFQPQESNLQKLFGFIKDTDYFTKNVRFLNQLTPEHLIEISKDKIFLEKVKKNKLEGELSNYIEIKGSKSTTNRNTEVLELMKEMSIQVAKEKEAKKTRGTASKSTVSPNKTNNPVKYQGFYTTSDLYEPIDIPSSIEITHNGKKYDINLNLLKTTIDKTVKDKTKTHNVTFTAQGSVILANTIYMMLHNYKRNPNKYSEISAEYEDLIKNCASLKQSLTAFGYYEPTGMVSEDQYKRYSGYVKHFDEAVMENIKKIEAFMVAQERSARGKFNKKKRGSKKKPHGKKPHGKKPHGKKPYGKKPHGKKPHGKKTKGKKTKGKKTKGKKPSGKKNSKKRSPRKRSRK